MLHPNFYLFLLPLTILLYLHSHIFGIYYYYYDYVTSRFDDPQNVFDFIVVGSGSAGAVVANRLSKNNKVLLLEAGGDPLPMQSIPGLAGAFLKSPYVDWNYKTVPQKQSSLGNQHKYISPVWRGKCLGGSSTLNYMMYVRSHPKDYDNWANITGDSSWSYENLLQYFKRSVSYYDGDYKANSRHYGQGKSKYGINIESKSDQDLPLRNYVLRAAEEAGYNNIGDLNGPQRIGYGTVEFNTKNGARHGTFAAYLKPILSRANLVVKRYALATKIKLDKNNHVHGVWYIRHGKKHFARATKEVIVSGGAVNSPQLLMLSGIGPRNHLKSLKIKPKIELPVGQNLQDHVMVFLPPIGLNKTEMKLTDMVDRDLNPSNFYKYLKHGNGPFTTGYPVAAQGFITTSEAKATDWPNMQLIHLAMGVYSLLYKELSALLSINEEWLQKSLEPYIGKSVIFTVAVAVRPKSSGEILLRENNANSYPSIDPKFLEDKRDARALIESYNVVKNLFEHSVSFQQFGAQMTQRPLPGCENHKLHSDQYLQCYVQQLSQSGAHFAGTCAMGKAGSSLTVVDSKIRVLHTQGLRVADASIMPDIVNGNTNAACIMIGEKASDIIREYWSEQFLVSPKIEFLVDNNFKSNCYYSRMT